MFGLRKFLAIFIVALFLLSSILMNSTHDSRAYAYSASQLQSNLPKLPQLQPDTTFPSQGNFTSANRVPIHISSQLMNTLSPAEIKDVIISIGKSEETIKDTSVWNKYKTEHAKCPCSIVNSSSDGNSLSPSTTSGPPPWYCVYLYSTTTYEYPVDVEYPYVNNYIVTSQTNNTPITQGFQFTKSNTITLSVGGQVASSYLVANFGWLQSVTNSYNNSVNVPAHTTYYLHELDNWTHESGRQITIIHSLTSCGWYIYQGTATFNWSANIPGYIGWEVASN